MSFFYQLKVDVEAVEPAIFGRRAFYYSVAHPSDQVIWASGSAGRIVRSDDGGKTWHLQHANTNEALQVLLAWNDREAVAAGGDGAILRTEDGGKTWTQAAAEMRPNGRQVLSGAITSSGRALLAGEFGTILSSDDHGRTWRHAHPEEDLTWQAIAAGADGKVWVVGEFGRVSVSDDSGATWRKVASPTDVTLTSIVLPRVGGVFVAGLAGQAYQSRDGGETWSEIPLPAPEHVFALAAYGEEILAFSAEGGVYAMKAGDKQWGRREGAPAAPVVSAASADGGLTIAGQGLAQMQNGTWRNFQ